MAAGTSHKDARADIVREFLEVSFHAILYTRGIYPQALFESRRKYNVIVKMCCHPELNQYIRDTLCTIHSLLVRNSVECVDLVLTGPDHTPLDCYSFIFQNLFPSNRPGITKDLHLVELEASLREALLKINVSHTHSQQSATTTPPLLANSSFLIQVHTNKQAVAELGQEQEIKEFPWVEVVSSTMEAGSSTQRQQQQQPQPSAGSPVIKVIDFDWIKMTIQKRRPIL